MMASPMNLSMVPPHLLAIVLISERYSIKDLPSVFGFEFVGPGRKTPDIGEEDRKSAAFVIRVGVTVALGKRIHELMGQVNLELIGQACNLHLGFQ